MPKAEKVPTKIIPCGKGRSALLQVEPSGAVVLSFRRPIQREHVDHGRLIRPDFISRDGAKRVATIALDEASAEAAYRLLRSWHEDRVRQNALLPFFAKAVLATLRCNRPGRLFFRR